LLAALAPDLMLGWPHPPSAEAAAFLRDSVANLPQVPRIAGKDDVNGQIGELQPDLILDYGDVSPRYVDGIERAQSVTGIPALLLDGALVHTPQALRDAGKVLNRRDAAEPLARLAEAVLAAVPTPAQRLRVVYGRGEDGLTLVRPGSTAADVFAVLGWTLLVPPDGEDGPFRHATVSEIAALDPDLIILGDPGAAARIAESADWQALRAVKEHLAFTAPRLPFGWIDEPPSINRLLGVAWLSGNDAGSVGALVGSGLFGRLPERAQLATLREQVRPIGP
jgi:iron complex transport system substrate-binding protein